MRGNPKSFTDTLECHNFNSYFKLLIWKLDAGGPLPGDPDELHPVTEPWLLCSKKPTKHGGSPTKVHPNSSTISQVTNWT